jgi:thiamine-phosphate pyrophosphorylase
VAILRGRAVSLLLREKEMNDDDFLHFAEQMRTICRDAGALFIVNDRVAISKLAGADGVHVGQDDLPVVEARKLLQRGKTVGVSTHNIDQAQRAQADGADYIGVGPIYRTDTKGYEQGVGVGFIREVAGEISIPFFAIGGITLERLDEIIAAGCSRVAVSSAIIAADDVAAATRQFKEKLASSAA